MHRIFAAELVLVDHYRTSVSQMTTVMFQLS